MLKITYDVCDCIHFQEPHLGGIGLVGSNLSEEHLQLVCRFDPSRLLPARQLTADTDTIGFFCAKFIKLTDG